MLPSAIVPFRQHFELIQEQFTGDAPARCGFPDLLLDLLQRRRVHGAGHVSNAEIQEQFARDAAARYGFAVAFHAQVSVEDRASLLSLFGLVESHVAEQIYRERLVVMQLHHCAVPLRGRGTFTLRDVSFLSLRRSAPPVGAGRPLLRCHLSASRGA